MILNFYYTKFNGARMLNHLHYLKVTRCWVISGRQSVGKLT
jgi:hypothetical protein